MCQRVECAKCRKPSYSGCGMHVEQVLGNVPREERCACHSKPKPKRPGEPSPFRRLFRM